MQDFLQVEFCFSCIFTNSLAIGCLFRLHIVYIFLFAGNTMSWMCAFWSGHFGGAA